MYGDDLPRDPTGWYALSYSRELARGEVRSAWFMDRPIVIWRSEGGTARVAEAFCPHMGAHLGHGGFVQGEELVCPFHHFAFHTDGHCARAYGQGAPKASLDLLHTEERDGLILAWHDRLGRDPFWRVPPVPGHDMGPLRGKTWSLASHPQETTENSVDLGHFSAVHGYEDVEEITPAWTEGPLLQARYGMLRRRPLTPAIRSRFQLMAAGLGYSRVEVEVVTLGVRFRTYVLPTPTRDGRIELRLAVQLQDLGKVPIAGRLLRGGSPLHRLLTRAGLRTYLADVHQDHAIWTHKRHVHPPRLARGDGPVGRYRAWARQFYPRLEDVSRQPARA